MLIRICAFSILIVTSSQLYALDIHDILENVRKVIDPFYILLNYIALIAGVGFMFRGLGLLKKFGMPLTQASQPGEIAGPLVYIVIGSILMYMPLSANILSYSLLGLGGGGVTIETTAFASKMTPASASILAYAPVGLEAQWQDIADTIILYVNFIGYIAFIRGWIILGKAGQPGVQPGTLPRGLVHIIGGILAINFMPMFEVVKNTIMG